MKLKINNIWSDLKSIDEIDIVSHPKNEKTIDRIESYLKKGTQINVHEIKTNRIVLIQVSEIESIISIGHISQVLTLEGYNYYLNKRLKDLSYLQSESLFKVNQSTILNLETIVKFNVEQHSRLMVTTNSKNDYLISRHYAKNIKEKLSC